MDLRQLRYFLAVADAGSLAGAARNLFVTQPTLTVALKKLEADLHATLFRHGSDSRYELTSAGKLLYAEGTEIVERIEALEDQIRGLEATGRENIRVGLTVLFAMQFMRQISSFIATHRNVEVTLIQGGSRELQGELARGNIDLGLLSFPIVDKDITIEPLRTKVDSYDVSVVMRSDNPLATRDEVTFADLRDQTFSSLSDKYVIGNMLQQRCSQAGYEPRVAFTNDNWEVLLTSVANLDTVCLLPAAFHELSALDGLTWISLRDRANTFPIGIATHRTRERSPGVDEFIAAIRAG